MVKNKKNIEESEPSESVTGYGTTTTTKIAGRKKKDIMLQYAAYCQKMIENNKETETLNFDSWTVTDKNGAIHAGVSGEISNQKFIRIATYRINNIIKNLDTLENLTAYDHNTAQAEKIILTLRNKIDALQTKFQKSDDSKKTEFIF